MNNNWQVGANFEVGWLLWGRQDSYLSDVDAFNYPDLRNRQRRGFELRSSLKLVKKSETVNFLFEPFIRYWHIQNSDTAVAFGFSGLGIVGIEPENNTTEAGIKFGVQY